MATSVEFHPPAPLTEAQSLRARCAEELAAVPSELWDALIRPSSAALQYAYLRAWEQVELEGLRSRPVLAAAESSARPVGLCPGYFYDLDLPTARRPDGVGAIEVIRRIWPRFLYARTYELGSPTPLTNPFLVADPALRPRVVPALISAALAEAERNGAQFTLVQNFTSRGGPAGEELARRGFAGIPILPTAVVNLPYDSFDEYLRAMRSQYRRRAQQTMKRSRELEVAHLDRFDHLADELARLWRCIYERAAEVKREILTPAFFRAVSDVDQASVLLTRRRDGSVASFALLLSEQPWLSFIQCGFESDAGRNEGAYFRLLYEIVRFGIEHGYRQVDLGLTTLAPKLDVGAVPVPLFAWVKHRSRLAQQVIRALANGPMKAPDVQPRKVFKDPAPSASELVSARGLLV